MKLYVLFGQRPCRYEGEYAPEALAVADEFTEEDNPDYMRERVAIEQATGDFTALRVIAFNVDGAKIAEALSPKAPELTAEIVTP